MIERVKRASPEGLPLPESEWASRHRVIVLLLFAQAVGLVVFALLRGYSLAHGVAEVIPCAASAVAASYGRFGRRARTLSATFGLTTSSAILVHLSGGTIEAHFHFFVMIGVISLYQRWEPFLMALGFVVAHHGLIGAISARSVYNHPAAWSSPWRWAAIHGAFIVAASTAQLVSWRFAELARRNTELMLQAAGEGMIGLDERFSITFANRSAAASLGAEQADLVGRSFVDATRPTQPDGTAWSIEGSPIEQTLLGGEVATVDDLYLDAPTGRFPVELISTPIASHGEVRGAMLTFRDVSARRAADAELRATLSLLEATLESTADGILVVNDEGKITSFNAKFVSMWQIPDDIITSGDDEIAIAFVLDQLADPDRFVSKIRELYSQPHAKSHDTLTFKDGRVFERYSQAQYVNGEAVGRVWSFRDVTERKRLDEMKDSFLTAVSHELRTPLTSVLGFAATLRHRDGQLPSHQKQQLLDRLDSNARRLQRLLGDLLDIDRLGRGILEPRRQPTDLLALARSVLAESEGLADREVHVTGPPVIVAVDGPKVERIIENLLTNAARHAPDDATIWFGVTTSADGVTISVEDDGPGVPLEHRNTIFESFKQGPTVSSHSPGVGIGLSLVARFAELHGGRAWVEDRLGGGASFRVFLQAPIIEIGGVA